MDPPLLKIELTDFLKAFFYYPEQPDGGFQVKLVWYGQLAFILSHRGHCTMFSQPW